MKQLEYIIPPHPNLPPLESISIRLYIYPCSLEGDEHLALSKRLGRGE